MSPRLAHRADVDAIVAVELAAAHAPWTPEAIASSLGADAGMGWVVEDDHGVIGHLVVQSVVDEAEVLTIAVHPRAQRQGRARQLLTTARQHWRDHGVSTAFLEVRTHNAAAICLYEAMGWQRVAVRKAYYSDGTDAVIMRWDLVA